MRFVPDGDRDDDETPRLQVIHRGVASCHMEFVLTGDDLGRTNPPDGYLAALPVSVRRRTSGGNPDSKRGLDAAHAAGLRSDRPQSVLRNGT
jgi:hypothetical protein